MIKADLYAMDKLHANLIESGRLSHRLSWVTFVVCIFFLFLSISIDRQPSEFKIAILGDLLFEKKHLVISGPIIIAIISLASALVYLCSASLSARLTKQRESEFDSLYFRYPSFENILCILSSEKEASPFDKFSFKVIHFLYKLAIRGLPLLLYWYLLWEAFQFAAEPGSKVMLYFSLIPSCFAMIIWFKDNNSLVASMKERISILALGRYTLKYLAAAVLLVGGITYFIMSSFQNPELTFCINTTKLSEANVEWSYGQVLTQDPEILLVQIGISNTGNKYAREIEGQVYAADPASLKPETASGRTISIYRKDQNVFSFRISILNPHETRTIVASAKQLAPDGLKVDLSAPGVEGIKEICE